MTTNDRDVRWSWRGWGVDPFGLLIVGSPLAFGLLIVLVLVTG